MIQDGPIQIIGVNGMYLYNKTNKDIHFTITFTDILNCDGIICPNGSIFCYVQIDSIGNLAFIHRLRVCMDLKGEKTKLVRDVRPNPRPGEHYHFYSGNYDIE